MYAVLEDGVELLTRHRWGAGRPSHRLLRETEAWLASDDTSWPFAFVNVCDALEIDAARVRRFVRTECLARGSSRNQVAGRASW